MSTESKKNTHLGELVKMRPMASGGTATTAAVGMVALATSNADAELIIQSINQTLNGTSLNLDLNQDSTDDFRIQDLKTKANIQVLGVATHKIFGKSGNATKFSSGDQVDGSGTSSSSTQRIYGPGGGAWDTVGTMGFIGLQLNLGGNTHYGWVEIERGSTIVGRAAFQNVVGAPAPVPEPSGLSLVALGAAGAVLRRNRRKKQAS